MSTTFSTGLPRLRRATSGLDAEPGAARAPTTAAVDPAVQRFIEAHREQGYRYAELDPTGASRPQDIGQLSPGRFGLSPDDVAELSERLKSAYCGALALDVSAVRHDVRRHWLFQRMEDRATAPGPDRLELLDRLVRAEAWEHHVRRRFPHGKRFSLEGCEALVPLLDALLDNAAGHGVAEIFMGMPHRGRLNVLANVLGMAPAHLLDYFDPASPNAERHRDLVYHLGMHANVATAHGDVAVTLACNPSHLQSVLPVVVGMTFARRAAHDADAGREPALAIVMHGDAAFAGQGVVMETLAMSHKPGYSIGGTVHVIINNQIGFTESNRMDARSARYCTDITRMVDAPVLRVNADAPDEVRRAAAIALDFRMAFGADVVIDLIGYRRLGHSEHDEPTVTSPHANSAIEAKTSVVEGYAATLAADGVMPCREMAEHMARLRASAVEAFDRSGTGIHPLLGEMSASVPSMPKFSRARRQEALTSMTLLPQGFEPHPVIARLADSWRRAAVDDDASADWCLAENLAYASVLDAGVNVRVSGLDVRRGTFLHRHAAWTDQAPHACDADEFVPLRQLGARGRFDIFNSVLSEEAVVGFEYGYSVQAAPSLTIWEAQFGDFVNGAQVYIDQYLSAGEEKWGYRSPLVLLLPHGYEGVGPEHSSAFLSRFLSLCGGRNLRVACPSTSAQLFHLLRRQAFDAERKPLVVMTPKARLYGDVASHSPLCELHDGAFEPLLDDVSAGPNMTRLVVCSGKLYHDLARARRAGLHAHVALVRIEELHPFPQQALAAAIARHPALESLVWAQEETRNQGAWSFVRDELAAACPPAATLSCVARAITAAGATSSHAVHQRQQATLVNEALGPPSTALR